MTDRLVLDWGVPRLVKGYGARLGAAGLPSVVVRVDGVEHAAGDLAEGEAPPLRLDVSAFDLFRAALGRRSLAQLGRLDWSGGDPGPVIPLLALFPPAERDIVE